MEKQKSSWSWLVGGFLLSASLLSAIMAKADEGYRPLELTTNERVIFQRTLNPTGGEFDDRCKDTVAMLREQGDDRSDEALMSVCLALPKDHAHICGIPREPGAYSIIENDRCYTLEGGIQQHAQNRKVEARERGAGFYEPVNNGSTVTGEDDGTGSAQ